MLEQFYDSVGNYGESRINLLKSNFKSIIENIISPGFKVLIAWANNLSFDKFVESIRDKTTESASKNKRFKSGENSEIDLLMSGIKYSENFTKIIQEHCKTVLHDFK